MVRVRAQEVLEGFDVLRLDDDQVKFFEGQWAVPEGVTYNAYLLRSGDEVVVFDTWKDRFADEFVEALGRRVDPREVTKVVVHHMEPDHSGALPRLLEENGFRAEVLGHPLSLRMIESFYRVRVRFRPVRDGEEMRAGDRTIRFITTPWLHWPETIMSFLVEDSILLPCDAFGGYSIPDDLFDDSEEAVSRFLPYARKYFANIIGSFREHVIRNVEKLEGLGIRPKIIAPAHGLIWRRDPQLIIGYYRRLAEGRPEPSKILVVSGSMYGLTEAAVRIALEEVERLGGRAAFYRFNDLEHAPISEVIGDAIDSAALILASPTYEGGVYLPLSHLVDVLSRKIPPKPVLVLGSYGWGGVAAKRIAEKLSAAGFKVMEPVEFQGSADPSDLERIRERVRRLLELAAGKK